MMVYLDSSVLIAFLYEATLRPDRYEIVFRLVDAIRSGRIRAMLSFYALPELYGYIAQEYANAPFDETFRTSLVELFNLPLVVKPFVSRSEFEALRKQITLPDPDDVRHVAAALANKCDAIITFDHHFREVSNLVPVYAPDEFLATIESAL